MKGTRTQYLSLGLMVLLLFVLISLFPVRTTLSVSEGTLPEGQLTPVHIVVNEQSLYEK